MEENGRANEIEQLKHLSTLCSFIPSYDGNQETLSDFINAAEFVFGQINENTRPVFLLSVKTKLISEAKIFISSRNITTWETLKQLLIGHFGDARDREGLIRDLTMCIQSNSETPRQFVQRIETLLTKLRNCLSLDHTLTADTRNLLTSSHEKIALKTILAGLKDPLGTVIRSQRPADIDEVINLIVDEEGIHYLKSKHSPNLQKVLPKANYNLPTNTRRFNTQKFCNYCKNPGHIISECRKRMYNNSANRISTHQNGPSTQGTFSNNNNFQRNQPSQNNTSQASQRPSVIQRNPTFQPRSVNHLNSQQEIEMGNLSLDSLSPSSSNEMSNQVDQIAQAISRF